MADSTSVIDRLKRHGWTLSGRYLTAPGGRYGLFVGHGGACELRDGRDVRTLAKFGRWCPANVVAAAALELSSPADRGTRWPPPEARGSGACRVAANWAGTCSAALAAPRPTQPRRTR